MKHVCVSGDVRAKEYPVLERWMRETATLLQGFRYYSYTRDYQPFMEGEVPGVSVLVGAAARAGYHPIAEYGARKISREDRRKRRDGRADLWFVAGNECYSFEFKRAWNVSSDAQLQRCLNDALADINDIPSAECDHGFGGVIAPIFDEACIPRYLQFNPAGYAFWLGDNAPQVFFFFTKRGN